MALSNPSLLWSGINQSNTATIPSASISPTANALLVALVAFVDTDPNNIELPTDTLSGTGTWVQVENVATPNWYSDYAAEIALYVAQAGSSPGSGVITGNFNANSSRKTMHIYEITGYDSADPTGVVGNNTGSSTTLTVTASGSPDSGSCMIGGCMSLEETGGNVNVDGAYTEITQTDQGTSSVIPQGNFLLMGCYDNGGADSDVQFTNLASTTYGNLGIVIEINSGVSDVTIACSAGSLSSAGQDATVVPGAVSVDCGAGVLAGSGEGATVAPGEVVVACNEGTLASAGESATVVPGEIVVACNEGTLASAGESASVAPGEIVVVCNDGTLASSGESASVTSESVIPCSAGVLASAGESASIVPGAVSVACAAGVLASNGESATIVPGGVNIACSASVLASNGESATVVLGGVNIACGAGALAGSGESASISTVTGVACNVGTLASAGESASVVPGAVSVACGAGVLASAGESATIALGGVNITCGAGVLTSNGENASLLVETVIQCATGTLVLGGESATVVPGAVSIACGASVIVSYGWKGNVQVQTLDVGYIETVVSGQVGFSENELKNLPDSQPASGYYNPDKAIDEDGIYYEHEIGKIEP